MKVGFDYDDTVDEHVLQYQVARGFLIRAVCSCIADREIFIISARTDTEQHYLEIQAGLKGILHRNLLSENIYLGHSGKDKAILAKSLGVNIFFDDDATVVASMIEQGIDAFLVGTFLSKQYRQEWLKVTPEETLALYPKERRNG